jgi:hypothetical protein
MKSQLWRTFVLTGCGLAATFVGAQVAPHPQVPILVTISVPSPEVKAGSELKLDVVMTNTSNELVLLSMYPWDFRIDVRDSAGIAVGETKDANDSAARGLGSGSYQATALPPHKVVRWKETLDKKLDLSKPGKYTIQVTRMYGKTEVKSNTITITVGA